MKQNADRRCGGREGVVRGVGGERVACGVLRGEPQRNTPHATRFPRNTPHVSRAFTLIEIMVVVAIVAIVMTLAIPMIYQQLHPESMRKAVKDVMEACSHARARAILDGVQIDLVIRPADRTFDLVVGSSAPPPPIPGATELFSPDVAGNDWRAAPRPVAKSGGSDGDSFFPVKLSDKFVIAMGINGEDYSDDEEGRVRFYPNGTSDECSIVMISSTGEKRNIFLEVVTALADVESDESKFKAR